MVCFYTIAGMDGKAAGLAPATVRLHRDLCAVCTAMELAETKPSARHIETSVASVRSSTSRCWFAGSTVNTLVSVITLLFVEMLVKTSLPSARAARSRTDPMLLVGSTTSEPPSSRATGIIACATSASTARQCLAKIAVIQYGLVPEGASRFHP